MRLKCPNYDNECDIEESHHEARKSNTRSF